MRVLFKAGGVNEQGPGFPASSQRSSCHWDVLWNGFHMAEQSSDNFQISPF